MRRRKFVRLLTSCVTDKDTVSPVTIVSSNSAKNYDRKMDGIAETIRTATDLMVEEVIAVSRASILRKTPELL